MNKIIKYDIIIEKGNIVDGTGNDSFISDIGIIGERIVMIGDLKNDISEKRINAENLVVSPGFIDAHTHTDKHSAFFPLAEGKVMQGVTTDVCGLCGGSFAPIGSLGLEEYSSRSSDLLLKDLKEPFKEITYKEFVDETNIRGNATNMAMFVGNANLRRDVSKYENRKLSQEEFQTMKDILLQSMNEGAFGLSSGLTYVPSMFSNIEELIELCKVIAPFKGIYNSHMRNEGNQVSSSVHEVIRIAKESGCLGHISHLKVLGKNNHGKSKGLLDTIDLANNENVGITFDVYPYTAGSTTLDTLLPAWVISEGFGEDFSIFEKDREKIIEDIKKDDWDNIIESCGYENIHIGNSEGNPFYEGKSIEQIAKELEILEIDALFKILKDSKGQATMIYHAISEEDLKNFIRHPKCMIGTDAYSRHYTGPTAEGKPHPRNYGAFPRYISKYLIEEKVLTLEEGIYRITGLSANVFGLLDRGVIKENNFADITIFDPHTIKDMGDYNAPNVKPRGIEWVLINGKIVVKSGEFNDIAAGKMLKFRK